MRVCVCSGAHTSVTVTQTVVCQIGSVVYILSQEKTLTVWMTAVQNRELCGGKEVTCGLGFITQNIHTLDVSVCLSLWFILLSKTHSFILGISSHVRFSFDSFSLFFLSHRNIDTLIFMVFSPSAHLSLHSLWLVNTSVHTHTHTHINTPWHINKCNTWGLRSAQLRLMGFFYWYAGFVRGGEKKKIPENSNTRCLVSWQVCHLSQLNQLVTLFLEACWSGDDWYCH